MKANEYGYNRWRRRKFRDIMHKPAVHNYKQRPAIILGQHFTIYAFNCFNAALAQEVHRGKRLNVVTNIFSVGPNYTITALNVGELSVYRCFMHTDKGRKIPVVFFYKTTIPMIDLHRLIVIAEDCFLKEKLPIIDNQKAARLEAPVYAKKRFVESLKIIKILPVRPSAQN